MSPIRMSRLETGARTVIAFNEAFNRHDVEGMMALMSADCIFENTQPPPDGEVIQGKEAVTQFWRDFFQASPQARIHIEELFGMGMRCVMRWRYEWLDADGNPGHVRGVDIYELKEGLISKKLSYVKG